MNKKDLKKFRKQCHDYWYGTTGNLRFRHSACDARFINERYVGRKVRIIAYNNESSQHAGKTGILLPPSDKWYGVWLVDTDDTPKCFATEIEILN